MPGFPVKSLLIAPLVFIASNGAPELTHTQTPYKSGLFLSQNSDWLSRLSENDPRETLVFPLRRMRFWVSSFRFCFFCTFRFIRRFALISGLRTASIFCFLFLSTFRRLCLSRTEPESSKNSEAPNFSISAPFRSSITCGIAATASGSSPGKPVSGTGWASVTWNTIETRGTPKPSRSRLSHDWTMEVISFIPEARLRDEASPALELRPHSRLISHLQPRFSPGSVSSASASPSSEFSAGADFGTLAPASFTSPSSGDNRTTLLRYKRFLTACSANFSESWLASS
mmetsp:Transcript_19760/g.78605  ORF Transcript_19760/g.78605 Transcript_19760/m.78605 type:complete len:285 (+) Transcript_19760:931-1785(+)